MGFGNFTAGLAEKLELLRQALEKKVDKADGMGLSESNYTNAEKDKLTGIEENANNYIHPVSPGSKHIPVGGSDGQILVYSNDGAARWGEDKDTTYEEATNVMSGLMSAKDKAKLEGIEDGANKYIHPLNHNAEMIVQDSEHRFVTDTEKSIWSSKLSGGDIIDGGTF